MHNLEQTIAILRDCETVIRSRLITDKEERALLDALSSQLPLDLLPPHAATIVNAIARYNERPRKGPFNAETATRPTEGKQDAAEVAPRNGSPEAEASPRPTEGKPEQAEGPGDVAGNSDGGRTATEAAPKAKEAKLRPARK